MGVNKKAVIVCCWAVSLLPVASLAAATSDSRLADAVKRRDGEAVHSLLKENLDVNTPQPDGTTALAWAAHWGDLETAELLIRAGASVNAANEYGVTPLSLACANGNAAMVEKLLHAGANPNAALVRTGETPLMACARMGNAEAVKLLLAHGADVNAKESRRGQTALMWAAAQKHPEVVKLLIEHGADIHARSKGEIPQQYGSLERKTGFTPLLFAARVGDVDSARILLEAGADINEATPEDGSALVVASASAHDKLAMFLLEKGADPNLADAYGVTALHYAIRRSILEIAGFEFYRERMPPLNLTELVKALLAHGADPNARIARDFPPNNRYHEGQITSPVGATPLLLAAHSVDVSLMQLLIANGADPMLEAKGGNTPLLMAAGLFRDPYIATEEEHKSAEEAVQLLLGLGADVNQANARGRTAIHAAAALGANALIQFLADKGGKVDAKDRSGETPWSIAEGMCPGEGSTNACGAYVIHKDTSALLLKLGAKPFTAFERDDAVSNVPSRREPGTALPSQAR
ncbi:MAG: ankyrin repeat domain-containing protein [Acidobacteria bacterium]|nr:ankyrin repeat domain-containing protein [Acidobacteriota bacterium]